MSQNHTKRSSLTAVPEARDHQPLLILFVLSMIIMSGAMVGIIASGADMSLLILITIGLSVLFTGTLLLRRYLRAWRLDQFGELTQGTIDELWTEADTSYSTEAHYITYTLDNNLRVTQRVNEKTFQILHVGESVPVRCLPEKPQYSRMELA